MLVLTRKLNESITAGELTITVVRLGEGRVRIAIDAPPDVRIVRTELLARSPRSESPRSDIQTLAEAAA